MSSLSKPEVTDGTSSQVEGAEILDNLVAFLRRFLILSENQAIAIALWCAHTYVYRIAKWTPYLAITSAEKRCGKSRLLELISYFVRRPWFTSNTTVAALFRMIELNQPTLLQDETDALFKGDREKAEAIRGVLNSGAHHKGAVSRCVGKGSQITVKNFPTFGPKALAGIGSLPDTVTDRSLVIRLRRKLPTEYVERLREQTVEPETSRLRLQLEKWAESLVNQLRDARPPLPEALNDRQQDGAEPLLAIADAAGGEWPLKARAALIELYTGDVAEDDSIGVQMLRDIREVFADKLDRISSVDLIQRLKSFESSPWGDWNNGKGLTAYSLGRLLRRFGISPRTIRINDSTPKGYLLESFTDTFSRFLPPEKASGPEQAETPPQHSVCGLEGLRPEPPQAFLVSGAKNESRSISMRSVADSEAATGSKGERQVALRCLPSCGKCRSFYVLPVPGGLRCESCGAIT
jgi:hypothetical protein